MSTTQVKERPILFSGPDVRAILEGRKTQTRRIIKADEHGRVIKGGHFILLREHGLVWTPYSGSGEQPVTQKLIHDFCPYGKPGERLWVRETWTKASASGMLSRAIHYRADGELECYHDTAFGECEGCVPRWRPSIHMPRWASRILLEVTAVRVERLNEIREDDAIAEGVTFDGTYWRGSPHRIKGTPKSLPTAVQAYRDIWEHINGKGSWDENPFVWCVEFKRVESEAHHA